MSNVHILRHLFIESPKLMQSAKHYIIFCPYYVANLNWLTVFHKTVCFMSVH